MIRKVIGIYFSPLGGTARMTETLASELAARLDECSPETIKYETRDLMKHGSDLVLDDETVAVVGMPVYVGKVPLPAVKQLQKVAARGAITVAAVSYGARTYGNALYELQHYAEEQGFKVIGAGAFSVKYRHKKVQGIRNRRIMATTLLSIQENTVDAESVRAFGVAAARKIIRLAGSDIEGLRVRPAPLEVNGRLPFHGISRFSPRAAAAAQGLLEKISLRHRDSEWYL